MSPETSAPQPPVPPEVLAFLRDAKDHPEDDTPRLILADWLEEHGNPRGGFLRTQCRLAKLPESDPRRSEMVAEEKRLLHRHQDEWLGPLREMGVRCEWRRGLLWLFTEARPFVGRKRIAPHGLAWVENLRLQRLTAGLASKLRNWPPLAEVAGLEVRHDDLDDAVVTALSATRQATGLRRLELPHNRIGPEGARALAAWPNLAGVRCLDLGFNPLGDAGVTELAASPFLGELVELRLPRSRFTSAGAHALARATLPRLRMLNVYGNTLDAEAMAALEARFGGEVYW